MMAVALIGVIKPSRKDKRKAQPVFIPEPAPEDSREEEERTEEEYTIPEEYAFEEYSPEQTVVTEMPETDYYRERPATPGGLSALSEETEEEERTDFDLRQAIIASEILKRPEY